MTESNVQGVGLALMLLALPVLSWSTTQDVVVGSVVGLVMVALGSVTAPVLRFMSLDDEEEQT